MKRTISFTLRMPEDLHAALDEAAKVSHFSMNALALDAISRSMRPPAETTVVEDVRAVWEADFTKLEERIMGYLHPLSQVTEVQIDLSPFDPEKTIAALSPTGRLSDRPTLSGLTTLATLKMGTMRDRVDAEVANLSAFKQFSGRIGRQPLKGQSWVITGSLETMTRDRAREILMELGATVAGSVGEDTHGLIYGPGAGSKLKRAAEIGVLRWNERQFIHMIQGMGIDMPLPKPAEQHLTQPGALEWDAPAAPATGLTWTPNTGKQPLVTKGKLVDLEIGSGHSHAIAADNCDWSIDPAEPGFDIRRWRLSSIELQPKVEQKKAGLDWTVNSGICPVEPHVKVDVQFRDGSMAGAVEAIDLSWLRLDNEVVDVAQWRLTKVEPRQPGAHWTENEGRRPDFLRPDQLIETQGRGVHKQLVGDIPASWWVSVGKAEPHIKLWRFAK